MTQNFSTLENAVPALSVIEGIFPGVILATDIDFKMEDKVYHLKIIFEVAFCEGQFVTIDPGSISGLEGILDYYKLETVSVFGCYFPTKEEYQRYLKRKNGI